MKWLFSLLAPIKSELFAMVGVLAVCGIGTTIAGYLLIHKQDGQLAAKDNQIKVLTDANQGWAKHAAEQVRLREIEQKSILLLEDKLALIEQQNHAASNQLKELEAGNAQVREYMSRPIPADLRRLLEKQ